MSAAVPLDAHDCKASLSDRQVRRDLKTLATFIEIYCRARHAEAGKSPAGMKGVDIEKLTGRPIALCPDCTRLLIHAFVKRMRCPMEPKPACKHCPNHCYHPQYRRQIREVMKYSGRKLVLTGRLDYLWHLLF